MLPAGVARRDCDDIDVRMVTTGHAELRMSENGRVIVRYAAVADAAEIAAVHIRSWQRAYQGHLDQDFLDALDPVARAEGWRRSLEGPADPGELVAIYVLPTEWYKGIGSQLMTAALTKLHDAEFRVATLWVLDGNLASMRFYAATGWAQDGSVKTAELGGRSVSEIRYQRAV